MSPPTAKRPASQLRQRQVFYRWLWLVYVPWLVGAMAAAVFLTGLLPSAGTPFLLALLAWNAMGVGLMVLRHQRGVSIPVPRTLVTGLAWLAALGIGGVILFSMGINRMTSSSGPSLMVVGTFLTLVALMVPAFKLVDVTLRKAARALGQAQSTKHAPGRVSQPRRAA